MGRIAVIDGLRGIAILGVIYHHVFYKLTPSGWHALSFHGFRIFPFTLLSNGYYGVTLFFLLSGVVLYLPYAEGTRKMTTLSDAWSFYKRRAFRLLPLLIGSTLIAIVIRYEHEPFIIWTLFLKTMWKVFVPFTLKETTHYPEVNWVLWSLRVEIWYSIVFPILSVGIRRFGMNIIVLGTIAIDTAIRQTGYPHYEVSRLFFFDSFIPRLDAFVVGMAIAHILCMKPQELQKAWILPMGIAMVIAGFILSDINIIDGRAGPLSILYPPRILAIIIGLTLLTGSLMSHRSTLASILSFPMLRVIGMMSYSVYVWHSIILLSLSPLAGPRQAILYCAILSTGSVLSFLVFEGGSFRKINEIFTKSPHRNINSS